MNKTENEIKQPPDMELERQGEFLLSGEITSENAARLSQSLLRLGYAWKDLAERPPIVLTLFSVGGILDAGFHLGATLMRLREMGFEVHTRIQGGAYSTAFLLAQYGTRRQMDSAAIAHIHTIQYTGGSMRADTLVFEDEADRIAKRKQIMAEVFAYRNSAGAPYNEPEFWMQNFLQGREHHLTAQECLEFGLVDEITGDLRSLRPGERAGLKVVEEQVA
jgi:ATP-dependent protease ClpP protease subunit